jgi:hypothetical protein
MALVWPSLGATGFSKAERCFGRLARRPNLSVFVTGLAALAIRLAILPLSPIPQPFVHDEFANLLAADTFSSGRLTNPTHPLWTNFESFHITHLPTYMSMYFPAQGLVLAAGRILTGNPWCGMWLAGGLMCAAMCWLLQGWLPPGWALFGGMLGVVRLALFSYWVNSYYGGAVACIGGALVLGALPRILRASGSGAGLTKNELWMAFGVAILANSRPWEGLFLCLPVACVLLRWAFKTRIPSGTLLRCTAAPALLLIAVAVMSAAYNHQVFGSAFTLPYQVNRATYAAAPVFIWQTPRPAPVYRYQVMRDFYIDAELREFLSVRTLPGFLERSAQKAGILLFFLFGFALLPPLVMLRRVWRDRRTRFLLAAGGIFALGLSLNAWLFPHYVAPFTGAVYVLFLQAMRHLRVWRPGGQPRGLALVRAIPVVCVLLAGLRLFAAPLGIDIPRWPAMWYGTEPLGIPRARVVAELGSYAGPQLAIVRYSPQHQPFDDWVYNAADIDKSKIVWAREAEGRDAENREADLLQYFHGRRVWLVEPDFDPPKILPYVGQALSPAR